MNVRVVEDLAYDHLDYGDGLPIAIALVVKGVKPITNRQRFDLGGNIALPARENELAQGMLIAVNCPLRLATAVPLIERQAWLMY